ncbi:uncharacterized protein LOC128724791 [Anopheles nili]|uniref:uncharacterized protein LOC128724791 n=1 Tax=Anopheles nili TaxID=185578 RepID=UPI00237B1516|nr:uncharacterized protein LOC128724791 [Anopheles nili]
MNKNDAFKRSSGISRVYAISLTPEKKKQLMQKIYTETQHKCTTLSDNQVRDWCDQLNQCFGICFESISLGMEIVTKLLSTRVAPNDVILTYRKLLTYIYNVLDKSNCTLIAHYMSRISFLALQTGSVTADTFPVSIVKCILVLMYQMPIDGVSERKIFLHALRSTLEWCKLDSNTYKQCGIGMLIRSAIASTKRLQDDVTTATELAVLAHHVLDVFYNSQTNPIHPVEVLLRLAFERIFTRLVSEWADVRCYELLLYVLYSALKFNIEARLKLDIVRILAETAGGGMRRLVRLLCIRKYMHDAELLHKTKVILTIVLAYSLFRFESPERYSHFPAFLVTIEKLISGVDFIELLDARFLCFNIPLPKQTIEHICFVFALRHLDLVEGVTSHSLEVDYLYNLIASVNIIYHKRWKVPSFFVKHFIDGLSRFSRSEEFQKSVSEPEKKVQAIMSTTAASVPAGKTANNIFGRLPVTIHRIQWLQLQPDDFKSKLMFHQLLAILHDDASLATDTVAAAALLAIFDTNSLIAVLFSKRATAIAQSNASLLLSRCSLSGPPLKKVLRQIMAICGKQQNHPLDEDWVYWVRAVYGSVHTLDGASLRRLWDVLRTIEQAACSIEQQLLVVDTFANLLVHMIPEGKESVTELHFYCTPSDKDTPLEEEETLEVFSPERSEEQSEV